MTQLKAAFVLIVAKCNVNTSTVTMINGKEVVLIVAKCNVNSSLSSTKKSFNWY